MGVTPLGNDYCEDLEIRKALVQILASLTLSVSRSSYCICNCSGKISPLQHVRDTRNLITNKNKSRAGENDKV
jgi:hypothetical protein